MTMRCPLCGSHSVGLNAPTRMQNEVLEYITGYQDEFGRFPTFREIADVFGWRSLATVHEHIDNLEKKGWVARDHSTPFKAKIVSARRWAA